MNPAGQECLTCLLNQGEGRAPGGVIYECSAWRLEHAIEPIPMVGWLVLKPLRHVEQFADLSAEEAAAFGPLTHRITRALRQVLQPEKIYFSLFAEAPGFAHLHVHVIPRASDVPRDRRGPRIFDYLRDSSLTKENLGSLTAAVEVAQAIRDLLKADDGAGTAKPPESR